MSFSDSIRAELWQSPIKAPCCRKAFLFGLLLRADVSSEGHISLSIPVSRTCAEQAQERVTSLVRHQCGTTPRVTFVTRGAHRYLTVAFVSRTVAETLDALDEATGDGDMVVEEAVEYGCSSCAAHFLRGGFLSCGTVGDPSGSPHMEFRLPAGGRAVCLTDVCRATGISPTILQKDGSARIYCKRLDDIRDLLSQIGCVHPIFEIINRQLYNEARTEEARATNWDAANIKRSVQAGQTQLKSIRHLETAHRLETLPPELQETARLRVQYPEASLAELAALHEPPITKSGLTHRLGRIVAADNE